MTTETFNYTVDGGIFTLEQRKFYEENGFIVFRKLVSDEDLDVCKQRFLDICDGKVQTALVVMKDAILRKKGETRGEYLVNKIQDFVNDDILFERYVSNKEVVKVVESIIGKDVCAAHSMLINKPPDSSAEFSRHPLHQDLHYFPFRPDNRVVASWTAMETVDERNGCLFVIPGSHRGALYPHFYPDGELKVAYHGVRGFDNVPRVNLIMEKGDTVFFHPLILHGSGSNMTKGFRKAISVHYANNNCHFINVVGTSQENIKKEVEGLARKMGVELDFVQFWQDKSRLVTGKPGNYQNYQSKL